MPTGPPTGPQIVGEHRVGEQGPVEAGLCLFLSNGGRSLLHTWIGPGVGSGLSYLPSTETGSFLPSAGQVSLFMGWIPPCVGVTVV